MEQWVASHQQEEWCARLQEVQVQLEKCDYETKVGRYVVMYVDRWLGQRRLKTGVKDERMM